MYTRKSKKSIRRGHSHNCTQLYRSGEENEADFKVTVQGRQEEAVGQTIPGPQSLKVRIKNEFLFRNRSNKM